ncbi:MAG: hypothetical protein AB7L28_28260, partial [Kofleriaceae bacterium]
VLTEQTPNVQYKIATADGSLHVIKAGDVVRLTKQRNPNYRRAQMPMPGAAQPGTYGAAAGPAYGNGAGVSSSYSSGGPGLPAPYARSGLRIDPDIGIMFPTGDLGEDGAQHKESFAPGLRVGFETLLGNFGLTAGGLARFTYWRMSDERAEIGQAHWTLETHLFGKAALHVGRAAPYVGLSLGLDTNYVNYGDIGAALDMESSTKLGFGMNVQAGIAIAASPTAAFDLGFDLHPGTDTVDEDDSSVSYFALRLGASIRL